MLVSFAQSVKYHTHSDVRSISVQFVYVSQLSRQSSNDTAEFHVMYFAHDRFVQVAYIFILMSSFFRFQSAGVARTLIHQIFTVNVCVSDCVVCPKLSSAITYREYVQFSGCHSRVILLFDVFHDQMIVSHDFMYIVYPLIVAQLSASELFHVNVMFGFIIVIQFSGTVNSGAVGHVLTIHVML